MSDDALNPPPGPADFFRAIRDADAVLRDRRDARGIEPRQIERKSLPSLLDRCHELVADARSAPVEPVRTIHHLACTGGTLIAKCLASMPNVQLLGEINPFSRQASESKANFHPTDLVRLARSSTRGVSDDAIAEMFAASIGVLHRHCTKQGSHLVLRDHAHSSFCFGDRAPTARTLRDALRGHFQLRSIVTVRHPLDSYLSLHHNGWRHFTPASLDEYAERYMHFLDRHADCELFYYEDFVGDADVALSEMTKALDLNFRSVYRDVFAAHSLSGDSGRRGSKIDRREPREIPKEVRKELFGAIRFAELCERLGYRDHSSSPAASAP